MDSVDRQFHYSNWVTYLSSRDFAVYEGTFAGTPARGRSRGRGRAGGEEQEEEFATADNASDVCNIHVRRGRRRRRRRRRKGGEEEDEE